MLSFCFVLGLSFFCCCSCFNGYVVGPSFYFSSRALLLLNLYIGFLMSRTIVSDVGLSFLQQIKNIVTCFYLYLVY